MRKRIKFFGVVLLVGLSLLIIISYVHAYKFTHYSSDKVERTDSKKLTFIKKIGLIFTGIDNPRPEDLEFPKTDFETHIIQGDKKLESWYMPIQNPKGLILLFHGYTGSKSQMISRAKDLNKIGYATAIIGFRGSGNSEGDYTSVGYEESRDVLASYEFYKKAFPNNPILLFGTSMGAAAILKAFTETKLDVNGIIIEYPFASLHQSVKNRFKVMGFPTFPMATLLTYFGGRQLGYNSFEHNPSEYAKKVNCPVLHLAGDKDDRVTNEETSEVFKNIGAVDKTLHIFKGAGHEALNENYADEWRNVCGGFLLRLDE
jgi:uncharacterized protein